MVEITSDAISIRGAASTLGPRPELEISFDTVKRTLQELMLAVFVGGIGTYVWGVGVGLLVVVAFGGLRFRRLSLLWEMFLDQTEVVEHRLSQAQMHLRYRGRSWVRNGEPVDVEVSEHGFTIGSTDWSWDAPMAAPDWELVHGIISARPTGDAEDVPQNLRERQPIS